MNRLLLTRLLALLLLFTTYAISATAQVTIGSTDAPNAGALLDLKSIAESSSDSIGGYTSKQGLSCPRVKLVSRDSLMPMYSYIAPDIPTADDLRRHRGLIVYNLFDSQAADLEEGFYYWDGSAWTPLQKGQGNAIFEMDCTPGTGWQVMGQYIEGKELTTSNSIRLRLDVTRKGVYNILLESDNGYYFTASGIFDAPGSYHIYALGQGTPLAVDTNTLVVSTPNDDTPCTNIGVRVLPATATYTFSCSQSKVRGVYKLNVPLDNTNYIELSVDVSNIGSYEIKTDEVDGISFYASGQFTTTGPQTVRLYGSGYPYNTKVKTMSITGNSAGGVFSCSINVVACIRKKKYLAIGCYTYGYTLGPNNSNVTGISYSAGSPVWRMITNPLNFGALEASTFKIEEVAESNWIPLDNDIGTVGSAANEGLRNITLAELDYYLFTQKPDIVFIGYYNSADVGVEKWQLLRKYLDEGGIVIANIQYSIAARRMIDGIFALPYVDNHQCTAHVLPLTGNLDDPVVNGPFGNLTSGKYWGADCGDIAALQNLPVDQFYIYSSGWRLDPEPLNALNVPHSGGPQIGEVTMCRHKSLNFFWCGEAAWYASVLNNTPGSIYTDYTISPFMYDPLNHDAPATKLRHGTFTTGYYAVDNAKLFANLFAWALTEAEFNGINKD